MNHRGFTLIEVMIAMAILGIGLAAMAPLFLYHLQINNRSELQSGAVAVAQQVLDTLRLQNPLTLPSSGSTTPQNIVMGGRTYQATTTFCAITTYCNAGSRHIQVEVKFRGKTLYTTDTVYTQLR
jgi:type IV pilus modification protein PilV